MAKAVLKTGKFTYDATPYGVTSMETSKVAGEIDLTDTATSGNEREYLGGRQERNVTVEMWKDVGDADPELGVANSAELDFEGFTYAGNIVLLEITQSAQIDNGVVLTVAGRFTGTVTETPAP
jgi:predicted secreted protein